MSPSGWITQGPEVAAFERVFAELVGAEHATRSPIAPPRCISRLLAVGVGPGDEVITASHSYIATATSIHYCGATPVFVDIDPATKNLDMAKLEGCKASIAAGAALRLAFRELDDRRHR